MKLREVMEGVEGRRGRIPDVEVGGIAHDSRQVKPGYAFVALPGSTVDGRKFARDAVERGAAVVVAEGGVELPEGAFQVAVDDSWVALARMSANFNGHPSRRMQVIGITGTNGKTSTAGLCEAVLTRAGYRVGVLGTINYRWAGREIPATLTTPFATEIQSYLREMSDAGCDAAVMEVSSHALAQHRTEFIEFDRAILTNITLDHLDYHGTFGDYCRAKMRLFQSLQPNEHNGGTTAIINLDDKQAGQVMSLVRGARLTYGIESSADVRARDVVSDEGGVSFTAATPEGEVPVRLPLIGIHNVYNALAAMACGVSYRVVPEVIAEALATVRSVPGRFEVVSSDSDFLVVVDYAHTPDALESAIRAARQLCRGKLRTVFGCGGDRDPSKRPIMGGIAEQTSEVVYVTSDNPRSEDPDAIIMDILAGMSQGKTDQVHVEPDRRRAITRAILEAQSGDLVLVAGKGHENYQILGDTVVPFDDRDVAREALRLRKEGGDWPAGGGGPGQSVLCVGTGW